MSQFQTDMKQKLLSILSEKNSKTTKHLKPCASLDQIKSNKLPVEMTNFERERWIFEMLCTQDIAKQDFQSYKQMQEQRNEMGLEKGCFGE
ncbi:hypothetical protein pb186bvf_007570 [Paramecium bursaria]